MYGGKTAVKTAMVSIQVILSLAFKVIQGQMA